MNQTLKYRARKLKKNSTQAETLLWNFLHNRKMSGYKFRRQYIIEPYIVDFICLRKKLIIELDGELHDYQKSYDARRTDYLNRAGYKVIRFPNSDIFNDDLKVVDVILEELK